MSGFLPLRKRHARKVLEQLDEHSGTGPDLLPSKVLKMCALSLSLPVILLARAIFSLGIWTSMWKLHWVFPLHKRKSKAVSGNCSELHLTSQLSKAVERLICLIC